MFKVAVSAADLAGTETDRSRRLETSRAIHTICYIESSKKIWKNHDKS